MAVGCESLFLSHYAGVGKVESEDLGSSREDSRLGVDLELGTAFHHGYHDADI